MAIVHLSGTKLAPQKAKAPLNQKFIYIIGFIFLVATHFYIPNSGETALALPFNTIVWSTFSIAIAIGCYYMTTKQQIRYSKLSVILFISCVLLTLPLLYTINDHVGMSLPRLAALWAGWLFFFILQQVTLSNRYKKQLLWFIIIAVLLQAILGYVQYLGVLPQSNLDNYSFTQLPFGIFQHPSVMVSFLSTGMLLSGYLLARQQTKYNPQKKQTFFLYFTPLFTFPLITLLASKIEWLGITTGFIFIAGYLYRFSTLRKFISWIGSAVCGIGLGMSLLLVGNSVVGNNGALITKQPTIDQSTLFVQAIDMLIEKPFTGYGYGSFNSEYMLYTARQHQLNNNYPSGISQVEHPMNEILYWGIEGGLIPVIGILLAAITVLLRILSVRKGTRLAIFSLFIPIVLHSQIHTPFYHSVTHWLIFIILLFWVDQRTSKYRTTIIPKSGNVMIKIIAFVVPVFTVPYMMLALQAHYTLFQFQQSSFENISSLENISSPENMTLLDQVISPVSAREQYEQKQFSYALTYGITNHKAEPIEQYINWSLDAIKHHPHQDYYIGLIMAYQALGELSKASQTASEARFLYPHHDFSSINVAPIKEM